MPITCQTLLYAIGTQNKLQKVLCPRGLYIQAGGDRQETK